MPCLQEYGNIGYHSTRNQNGTTVDTTNVQLDEFATAAAVANQRKSKDGLKKNDHMKPVVPIISIDLPD